MSELTVLAQVVHNDLTHKETQNELKPTPSVVVIGTPNPDAFTELVLVYRRWEALHLVQHEDHSSEKD